MKKSTIWLLAVIMALTFIGLLYVQIMYMENMIKMRNEQFTEAVKRSLYAVSTSLELDETQRYLDEYLEEEEKKMLSSYEQKQDKQDIASTHHQFSIVSPDGTVASFPFANKPVRLLPLLLHDKRNTIRSLVHIEICRKPVKDNTFTKRLVERSHTQYAE